LREGGTRKCDTVWQREGGQKVLKKVWHNFWMAPWDPESSSWSWQQSLIYTTAQKTTDLDEQWKFEAGCVDRRSVVETQTNDVERQPREREDHHDSHQHLDHFHLYSTQQVRMVKVRILSATLFVIQWQQKERKRKQQANKQLYKYSQFKSFNSRLAKPETTPQIELRLFMNFVKNFRLRLTIRLDTVLILNMTQHSCTISTDPVLNIFIKRPIHTTISAYTYSPLWIGNQSRSYGASPAIWDHTVLPATRHR